MTKPYQSAETKKRQVQTMFDGIADHYDLLNRMLSFGIDRGWRRRTVDRVVRLHPTEILDMATGTGDLAIQLARRIPLAHVTGVDLSEGMLSIGKEKAQKKGLSDRIDFVSGDAESAAYGTERFDVATVATSFRTGVRHAAEGMVWRLLQFLFQTSSASYRWMDLEGQSGLHLSARFGPGVSVWRAVCEAVACGWFPKWRIPKPFRRNRSDLLGRKTFS